MPDAERASGKGTGVDSGTRSRTPSAYYSPASSCLRTWQQSLGGDLDSMSSSVPLPPSGSMLNGCVYEHQMPERRTAETACSSSPGLLPTPNATDWKGVGQPPGRVRDGRPRPASDADLPTAVQLLKTPTAQLAVNGGSQHPDKRRAGGHGPTLADQVEHQLLPTPAARDWKSGQSNLIGTNARPLNEVVEMLLPTPRAADGMTETMAVTRARLANGARWRGTLEEATARLSGASTNPSSADGRPSSAGQHHVQLSLDGLESA